MRILYLCHRIPYPPNKGEKIRAFHQLKALARQHEVDLFSLADPAAGGEDYSPLRRLCRRVVVAPLSRRAAQLRSLPYFLTRTPLTLPCFQSAELARSVREAVLFHSFDRILVYCSAMAQYVDWVRHIPIVTDLVDVDSDKWRQYAAFSRFPASAVYRREAKYLREYERKVCRRSSSVIVSTEREAQLVRQIRERTNVQVVVNGVDADFFRRTGGAAGNREPAIIFTGDMGYFPNVEAVTFFVKDVFPLVRRAMPAARFLIVGRNPVPAVRRLQAVEGVEVTGFVEDVREYLARAQVAVAPFTIAAGIQNKILEALAYELPVVATRKVLQGLCVPVAEIVHAGETPQELSEHVVGLLNDPVLAREIGMEGRRRVIDSYNWDRSGEQLLDLLEAAAVPHHEFYSSAAPDGGRGK